MRTGLIAALKRTDSGELRAGLLLAGRSILAWQTALLQTLGAERIICLCHNIDSEILRLQRDIEAAGGVFHVLTGFAGIAALVRAEDELIILRDGLVPDPASAKALTEEGPAPHRMIACLSADHPLTTAFPEDFERINAQHHWAGLLVMRGAPVQQLADFPADADAMAIVLRLALQAGTPCRDVDAGLLVPGGWLLADSAAAVTAHEEAMIAQAPPESDWRAPLASLAGLIVTRLAPRGLENGALIAACAALMLGLGGVMTAAFGAALAGLSLCLMAAFAEHIAAAYARLDRHLQRKDGDHRGAAVLGWAGDGLAGATIWFALSPGFDWTPLAVCGPVVVGLARLAARHPMPAIAAFAGDRANLLMLLAVAAGLSVQADAVAMLALIFLGALLLQRRTI
jgi:hypothetical protein